MREYTDKIDIHCQMCKTRFHDLWEVINDHVEECYKIHPSDKNNYDLAKSHIRYANYLKELEKLRWENRKKEMELMNNNQ